MVIFVSPQLHSPKSQKMSNAITFQVSILAMDYKQLLDKVFGISRIITVEVRVRVFTTLIILNITKMESNNWFIIH